MSETAPHLLIIEARFYDYIADAMLASAVRVLEEAGATYERVSVPGALEIPAALSFALGAMDLGERDYDGFIALGCVIRGETTHYDIVAGESARALMDLAVDEGLALANGILTVENRDQARARALPEGRDKGGYAARVALEMIALKAKFGV